MDLVNDADNCGACGKACSQTQVCKSGKCGSCAGGRVRCDTDACVDFATDEDNCGKCGHVCPQGWTCSRARCEP